MIKHIVFFQLKDNSLENKNKVQQKLLSLKTKIEVLQKIEVGINFCQEDRAYDIALLTDFVNKEDLETYAMHPYHLEIVTYIKSIVTSSKVVDFLY